MTLHPTSKRAVSLAVAFIYSVSLAAQTKITPPSNKYSPAEDVQLGREAAAEARKQLPLMNDDLVSSYVERLGERLVDVIPADLQHKEFHYTFETVNVRDINAFALPGGPMFVNRGMIEAAGTEGEVVGVMAHELSHVLLRHGTAQASKATGFQLGQIAGAVAGAILGGTTGAILSQGVQFGLGTAFLRYGREYERQADLLGAQLMAKAGYDPRDMANMFKTIEKQGGSGGPEWLSDHPNPGNRSDYIVKEAAALKVQNPIRQSSSFDRVKSHLRELPKAPTSEEAAKGKGRSTRNGTGTPPSGRVSPPSSSYRQFTEGDAFRVSVPSNWNELPSDSTVTFAPNGAYGDADGQSVFTHGVQFGIDRPSGNLRQATDDIIEAFRQGNPQMRRTSQPTSITFAGKSGLQTRLTNMSEVTGREETIQLLTTTMDNGDLMYAVFVSPTSEWNDYKSTFQRVASSVRLLQ